MIAKKIKEEINNFINNISYLRKKSGLSKKEMANILNISVYELSEIEKGEIPKNASIEIIFNLQKHFKISPPKQFNSSQGKK